MEVFRIVGTFAIQNQEAIQNIEETTDKAEESEGRMSSAFKKIATAVAAFLATDRIIAFGKACVEAAAQVKAANSQFEQTFGEFQEEAESAITAVADASGILETRLQGVGTSIYAFAKTSGMDSVEALTMMEEALQVTADSAAYYDRSLEDTAESLKSFLKGNFANDAALGLSCTETTRNTAANKLYGKSYIELSEAQKQLTLLQMVKDANELSGAMGQAARESDGYENVLGNLRESIKQFQAVVGEPILTNFVIPAVKALTEKVIEATETVKSGIEWIEKNREELRKWEALIISATTTVGTFLLILNWGSIMSAATTGIQNVAKGITVLNRAIASNPIGAFLSLLVGIATYFVYLYQTSESFRKKVDKIVTELAPVVESFVNNALTAISQAIEFIKPIIEQVMAWFKDTFSETSVDTEGILNRIQGFFSTAWEFIKSVWDECQPYFFTAFEAISTFFSTVWETIQGIWQMCQPFFQAVWDEVIKPLAGLVVEIIGAFQEAWNVIVLVWQKCKPFFASLWEVVKAIFIAVVPFFKGLWENIKSIFSVVGAVIGGFFKVAWEIVKSVWRVAISFFTALWANIRAIFAVVGAVLSGDFEHAWELIKNAFSKTIDFFKTLWQGIKDVFGSVADWFKNVFSTAWQAVKDGFSTGGKVFGV